MASDDSADVVVVGTGDREPAEHYWEQLREHGLTLAPLETG